MPLTLEVVGEKAASMRGSAQKTFTSSGTIGRLGDNDWIFPGDHISGHHAKISFRNGTFQIEDTSTNGVFVNSPGNRLVKGRPYTLRDGDTVFLDDYEVRVTLSSEAAPRDSPQPYTPQKSNVPLDPFPPVMDDFVSSTDPMDLLGVGRKPKSSPGVKLDDLERGSPEREFYQPPQMPEPLLEPVDTRDERGALIPEDYDPCRPDDEPEVRPVSQLPVAPKVNSDEPAKKAAPVSPERKGARESTEIMRKPRPGPRGSAQSLVSPVKSAPPTGGSRDVARREEREVQKGLVPEPHIPTPGRQAPETSGSQPRPQPSREAVARPTDPDFAELLAAAGVDPGNVTTEVSQQFGKILRVVVSGLMDVLRAREKVKDEFRMHMTSFKQEKNNPLKFSANVEDALHNLLVKRNKAFMGPVEAFEDAFQDLRNHQMAMLAGLRVAYEAMLADFDPDKLQQDFDRHGGKSGGLFPGSAKQKYWELYRAHFHDMVKDADSSFRRLFGDDFAKAYEKQLASLRAAARVERK